MKKILTLLIFLFVLAGCIENAPVTQVDQTPTPEPTVEPTGEPPIEPTPTDEGQSFDELFWYYKAFTDAHVFGTLMVFQPYYKIPNLKTTILKDDLIETYENITHEAVAMNYSNIYYMHIFHYIDVFFQDCDTSSDAFSCYVESWDSFYDINTDVIMEGHALTIDVQMYYSYDDVEYGFYIHYDFDIIDDKIVIDAAQIETADLNGLGNEVTSSVYVELREDQSFEIIYHNQIQDVFNYHFVDYTNQNEVSYFNASDEKIFYYIDHTLGIKQELGDVRELYQYQKTTYYIDGIHALTHDKNQAGTVILYNMMMVDGWHSYERSSDGNSVLALNLTDYSIFSPTNDTRFRTDINQKIMIEMIRSGNDLNDITIDLSDIHLSFTAISLETIEAHRETFMQDIERVMETYGFYGFHTIALERYDAIFLPFRTTALDNHNQT
ncbi:MAG: PT domain-containing protein [Acholeplasmataceae bacterium]